MRLTTKVRTTRRVANRPHSPNKASVAVADVHVGRHLVIQTVAADAAAAEASVRAMCAKLLANPVTEDFEIASVVAA
ncbi:phosphoribosylformylglycinamidine synthase [bacterium]|nr:phosphoribosylformylglycinamidine synthase [bacterium]